MKPVTTVIHSEIGDNVHIHCSSLSAFAGSLVGLVQQAHNFLCTHPQDTLSKHFSFTYDGMEVATQSSKHTQLMDEVAAMIDLLPVIYCRLDKSDPKLYKLVGSFKENQNLRDYEYRLKDARSLVAQQIVRNTENALDVAYLRDLLASCNTQPLVIQALAEGWTRENGQVEDFADYCQGDSWSLFDPSKVDTRDAVREFTASSFVVDLSNLTLGNEQLDGLVKDINDQGIAAAKHEKGVVFYYTPYYVDQDEPAGF
jgi:hypothetical protein